MSERVSLSSVAKKIGRLAAVPLLALVGTDETPFAITLGLWFSGDELIYGSDYNVAFGPTKQAQLVGHAQ